MSPVEPSAPFLPGVQFWMLQEATKAEYARHQAKQALSSKEEQKKQFASVVETRTREAENALHRVAQLESENEELKSENHLLQEKHQASRPRCIASTDLASRCIASTDLAHPIPPHPNPSNLSTHLLSPYHLTRSLRERSGSCRRPLLSSSASGVAAHFTPRIHWTMRALWVGVFTVGMIAHSVAAVATVAYAPLFSSRRCTRHQTSSSH